MHTTRTNIPAIGGGTMIRDTRTGRFIGSTTAAIPAGYRMRDGILYRVTTLPDAPVPKWCQRGRGIGKSQHGKRGGYREGNREKWAHHAYTLHTAMLEG